MGSGLIGAAGAEAAGPGGWAVWEEEGRGWSSARQERRGERRSAAQRSRAAGAGERGARARARGVDVLEPGRAQPWGPLARAARLPGGCPVPGRGAPSFPRSSWGVLQEPNLFSPPPAPIAMQKSPPAFFSRLPKVAGSLGSNGEETEKGVLLLLPKKKNSKPGKAVFEQLERVSGKL